MQTEFHQVEKKKRNANDEIQMIQKKMDYLHSKGGKRDWERWKHLK